MRRKFHPSRTHKARSECSDPIEIAIGLRYTRAKRRNHFISFISLASMLGIAIGVTALITVISVMNGFEQELRARILGMVSHATISGAGEDLQDWPRRRSRSPKPTRGCWALRPTSSANPCCRPGAPRARCCAACCRSASPRSARSPQLMTEGEFDALEPGKFRILVGADLALYLGVAVGDSITVMVPEFSTTPVGVAPQMRRFTVAGIFSAGMQEYDRQLAHCAHAGCASVCCACARA